MADAKRDENFVPTLIGVSDVDGSTPVTVYVDPTTHRLKVDLSGGGSGTVTNVSVATANGFAGTVATATTTPVITLTTTITGILQGNGTAISAATTTGTGSVVLATSPTLTTPNIGTPSAGTLTNCTGLPISTGVAGLGTGVATFLTTPSSANLAAAVTDETGSGALVFATSPTLVTPVLGTPTSGTLTNCTGLPLATGVTGTLAVANGGTGVTTSTGTGNVVLSASPTFTGTPVLPSTFTIGANSFTRSGAHALTLTTTATTNATFPTGTITLVGTAATQTLTNKTLTAPRITSASNIADANGNELILFPSAVASAVNEITVSNAATGNGPSVSATGGDTNIPLNLAGKGTGNVRISGGKGFDANSHQFGDSTEVDNGNSGTADTIDWGAGNFQKSTLTGNVTYTFTAPTVKGRFQLMLVQDATGSRTATWPASVKWPGGTAPTLSTAASSIDIISFYYDGTNYYGVDSLNFS